MNICTYILFRKWTGCVLSRTVDSNNADIYVSLTSISAGVSFMSYADLQTLLSFRTLSYLTMILELGSNDFFLVHVSLFHVNC